MHDAFRAELTEGFFRMGQNFSYIDGSNVTKEGNLRCHENFGPPLVRSGDNLTNLDWCISQEMFVYHRGDGVGSHADHTR